MKAIVAVDNKWGIGKGGGLLYSIPEDMKFFRETTKGGVVVMGRKTLESFPGGKPLKNRVNVVISHNPDYAPDGVIVIRDEYGLKKLLAQYEEAGENVFLIGGASIYEQFINLCETAYITKMYADFDAEKFFPNLDENSAWMIKEESNIATHITEDGESVDYKFVTYRKKMSVLTDEELDNLKKEARKIFPERVKYFAPLVGVEYGRITIRAQRTKWGSCSGKGNLNFNCLLLLAPPQVLDSVVVHELCHLKEMNHSKDFYAEVYKVMPDYEEWHKWLKKNGAELMKRLGNRGRKVVYRRRFFRFW